MQKVKKSCRKLAQKLSCMYTPWEEPEYPARSGDTALASLRTPAGSSEPVTGMTSALHTPPHYSTRKGPADKEDEDDEEAPGFHIHHHQRDPSQQDEISMSQQGGAPLGTQGDEHVLTMVLFLRGSCVLTPTLMCNCDFALVFLTL